MSFWVVAKEQVSCVLHMTVLQVIDGGLPMEDVENQIRELALDCIAKCKAGKTLANLWLTSG